MKKCIIIFASMLLVFSLLAGCGVGSSVPVQPELPIEETQPLQPEPPQTESQPTQSQLPLLEQGTVLEESSNLLYIPNPALESMITPELRLLGHGLLLSECTGGELVLKHISLDDGTLLAETSIPADFDTKLSIGEGEIGLCDRASGQITVLDENLCLLRTYEISSEGDDWFLNTALDTLYIFYADRGLLARNLVTGEERWLEDNGFQVTPIGSNGSYVIFTFTDRADQRTYTRCLNLSTAMLETLPVDGAVDSCVRQRETWLIQRSGDSSYTLTDYDTAASFVWSDSPVQLLTPKQHLLVTDAFCRTLTLYESDGSFRSQCVLPQSSSAMVGSDFIWSGYWEGYFFTDFVDTSCRLMFWDVNADSAGEALQMLPAEEIQPSQQLVEASLYERAAELSQRFGVDIRIAEQCSTDYSHYETYALTDSEFLRSALDIVEESLSMYPEGFFRQLTYGSIETIRIELVGALMLKSDISTHTNDAGAFAQNRGSYYLIALDGFMVREATLYHEISHIIDARLKWDALIREDALFSEETWLSLQPEGFQYAMSYIELPESVRIYADPDYFITDYALTFPTEDRATLMESAMQQFTWTFEAGSGTAAKLQYYADCIRDCFDTEGWPEQTSWEQVLR